MLDPENHPFCLWKHSSSKPDNCQGRTINLPFGVCFVGENTVSTYRICVQCCLFGTMVNDLGGWCPVARIFFGMCSSTKQIRTSVADTIKCTVPRTTLAPGLRTISPPNGVLTTPTWSTFHDLADGSDLVNCGDPTCEVCLSPIRYPILFRQETFTVHQMVHACSKYKLIVGLLYPSKLCGANHPQNGELPPRRYRTSSLGCAQAPRKIDFGINICSKHHEDACNSICVYLKNGAPPKIKSPLAAKFNFTIMQWPWNGSRFPIVEHIHRVLSFM